MFSVQRLGLVIECGAIECVRAFRVLEVEMEEYITESIVRGHHVYKSMWHPILGELLILERELRKAMVMTTSKVVCLVEIFLTVIFEFQYP